MVLAAHAHPSVSTMARTLLSGANIVYNGNPLNDLSLIAFLEKLMEKKPKQTTWHGRSPIEPAKKVRDYIFCFFSPSVKEWGIFCRRVFWAGNSAIFRF